MPYIKDGKTYTRMTEFVGYGECEALAYNDKHLGINRPRKGNIVTLPGTITHHKIAENEMKMISPDMPPLVLELEPGEREQFIKMQQNHRKQKKIQKANVDGRYNDMDYEAMMTKYEILLQDIMVFYGHYEQFVIHHPHKPLFVEQQQFWERKLLAGTLDLVAVFKLKGIIVDMVLHEDVGSRKYFVENENHPDAEEMEVATITDWKTSKSKQKGHPDQLSGYHFMWEDLGEFDKIRKRGYPVNSQSWSVLVGKPKRYPRNHPEGQLYQLYKYDTDSSFFLIHQVIRDNPRPITSDLDGNVGLKGRCMFCSEAISCPENFILPHNFRADEIIPLVPFRLVELTTLRLAIKDMNQKNIHYLKDKLDNIYNELVERQEIYENSDLDVELKKDVDVVLAND